MDSNDKQKRYRYLLWETKPPLWQMHHLNNIISKKVLLFEGCWSAMRWQQTLEKNNVQTFAILGAYPSKQLYELFNGVTVYYVADNDTTGLTVIEQLKQIRLNLVPIITEFYPDEMSNKQIKFVYERYIK